MPYPKIDPAVRFRRYTAPGGPSECWDWQRSLRPDGYGQFWVTKTYVDGAHRFAWILANGASIPRHQWVLHRCDNPRCVNPAHLFLGTPQENQQDCIGKGRKVVLSGEANAQAKLTEDQVAEIRTRRALGEPLNSIARDYGITFQNVSLVARGKTWR